jgi:hypothetical protein
LSYYELTADSAALTTCRKMGDLLGRTFGTASGQRDIVAGLHVGMAPRFAERTRRQAGSRTPAAHRGD